MSAPVANAPLFRRLALVGIGLIGSSVARIARERGDIAAEVVVTARTPKTLERVRQLGFADRIEADPRAAVEGADAVEAVSELWRRCGSMVECMDPAHHDRVLAIVSHLPHLIAFTICGTADDLSDESRQEVLKFAASGFRDFTRIAASDPVMWRDIFLNNREALLEMLARFTEDAQAMAKAVRWGDAAYIEDKVERGRKIRRSLIELKQA